MKKILAFVLGLTLVSCGGADDDDANTVESTFLEENNGVGFLWIPEEVPTFSEYVFFFDEDRFLRNISFTGSGVSICRSFREGVDVEVVTNNPDTLVVRLIGGDVSGTYTFTIDESDNLIWRENNLIPKTLVRTNISYSSLDTSECQS